MTKTNYQKGADFERKVVKYFEELGYLAIRSAGSHGPFDVIAIPKREVCPGIPILIQAKRHGQITKEELDKLRSNEWAGTAIICWHKPRKSKLLFTNMLGEDIELDPR